MDEYKDYGQLSLDAHARAHEAKMKGDSDTYLKEKQKAHEFRSKYADQVRSR